MSRHDPATDVPTRCPRCAGAMIAGFLLDQGDSAQRQARWVAGERTTGWKASWLGVETPKDPVYYRVVSFRCARCGYLESYARERV